MASKRLIVEINQVDALQPMCFQHFVYFEVLVAVML